MTLTAKVLRRTGNTRHVIHGRDFEDIGSKIASVEIEHNKDGFFLYYLSAAGEYLTDTWHQSLGDAKKQAMFEFEIEDADWREV